MVKQKGRKRTFFLNAGHYFTALTCFFIPLSTSLLGIFSGLTVLCWLFSGNFLQTTSLTVRRPFAFVSALLFLLFIIGVFYSPVPIEDSLDILKKYRELAFIPILISLFYNQSKAAAFAVNCFVGGLVCLLISSYIIHFDLIPFDRYGDSHIHHITHSFFMAILAFWAMHKFCISWQYKYYWLIVFFAATFNLVFISTGRTGMFTYIILTTLFLIQKLSFKKFILGTALIITVFAGIYSTSDNISFQLQRVFHEIKQYDKGQSTTSVGMRFDWFYNSITLIKQRPVFGHGTGSFEYVQEKLIEGKKTVPTDNPHNEYLFIGVQIGLIGMATFVLLFLLQLISSLNLNEYNRNLLQGVIISMMAGCVMNSFLFDSMQGHYYGFLAALIFSSCQQHCSLKLKPV